MSSRLVVSDHPLVQERLAALRDKATPPREFRRLMEETSCLIGCEIFKGLRTRKATVMTPLQAAPAVRVADRIVVVAVLRAGLGMTEGLLRIVPEAEVGHIGLYRNEETLNPVRYYVRLPRLISEAFVVLCDPMLATGGSACEAISILKTDGAKRIVLLSLISSRAGIRRVHQQHPDVPVYTAGVDARLNKKGYILPGLGDAGDRLFAT